MDPMDEKNPDHSFECQRRNAEKVVVKIYHVLLCLHGAMCFCALSHKKNFISTNTRVSENDNDGERSQGIKA